MDAQGILKSLSSLEQKLQSIESARQQVERTVNAYDGAKAQLSVLTKDFTDIYQELKNVLTEIQNSKNNISLEVSDKADVVFKALEARTTSLSETADKIKQDFITACKTANQDFSKAIEKSENDLANGIFANINEIRKETIKEIEKASGIVTTFTTAASDIQKNYQQALSSSAENQKTVMGQITTEFSKSVEQYIISMRNVRIEMESILERYNSVSTRIEEKLDQVETELKSSIEKLDSNIEEKSKTLLDSYSSHSSNINEHIDNIKTELNAGTSRLASDIASSSASNKQFAKNLNDKMDSVLSQLLDANYKSHKLIIILVIGLTISVLLNILSIAKVI